MSRAGDRHLGSGETGGAEKNILKVITLVEKIRQLSPQEALELSQALEETFHVTGVPFPPGFNASVMDIVPVSEPERADVLLTRVGTRRLEVLRLLREYTGLSPTELMERLGTVPMTVEKDMEMWEADRIRERLEAAGAGVELKKHKG